MYRKNVGGWLKHADFIVLDLLCIQLAFYLSFVIRQGDLNPYILPIYRNMAIFIELADLIIIFLLETYKNVLKRGYYKEFSYTIKQAIMLLLLSSLYLIIVQDGDSYSRVVLFLMIFLYIIITYVVRIIWKNFLNKNVTKGQFSLVIVTSSCIAREVVKNIREKNHGTYALNGLIIVDKDMTDEWIEGVRVVSNLGNGPEALKQMWVDEVFINVDDYSPYPNEIINRCYEMGLAVHVYLAKTSKSVGGKQSVEKIGGYTVLTTCMNMMTIKQAFMKRVIDICAGLVGCLLTGIIFIFVAPIIYINSPGPIFFSQERIGQNGKTFKMYKFRSMYLDAEDRKAELMKENKMSNNLMFKMDFDPRIIGNKILPDGTKKTGIGQFIRSTSLDEFPQFWNVLIGQMSVVGFRPALPSEYEQYNYHHRARISMKPGITGMWQVSGRSDISDFEEVVNLDTDYLVNWSVGLDLKIILLTVKAVLKRDGSV